MISEQDLWDAIRETERLPDTYSKCQKLATFYSLLNYLYPHDEGQSFATPETFIDDYGDTDLFVAISGQDARRVWNVLNELMETLQVLHPRLYEGVLRKLNM